MEGLLERVNTRISEENVHYTYYYGEPRLYRL